MAPNQTQIREYAEHKAPSAASPSASVLLVSPQNRILLLHRVQTSSAFPSAHVFPGGNVEPSDGPLSTTPTDPARHKDNITYRTAAIRELFEETGILLAKQSSTSTRLLEVSSSDRHHGRKQIHNSKLEFQTWLRTLSEDAVLDTSNLIPFTHWVTPPNVPKRFTTQMYLYFVHLRETGNPSVKAEGDEVETMAPEWRYASEWLDRARKGEIILFPPQFLLLFFASRFLDYSSPEPEGGGQGNISPATDADEIVRRRKALYEFITQDGSPPWSEKFISPIGLQFGRDDGRAVLGLDKPGPELKGSELKGDDQRVVLVRFKKEGPREVEVRWKKEVMEEERTRKNSVGDEGGYGGGKGRSKL